MKYNHQAESILEAIGLPEEERQRVADILDETNNREDLKKRSEVIEAIEQLAKEDGSILKFLILMALDDRGREIADTVARMMGEGSSGAIIVKKVDNCKDCEDREKCDSPDKDIEEDHECQTKH